VSLTRETREQWGAPPDRGRRWVSKATAATGGVAVHYPGAMGSLRGLSHEQCRGLLRQWAAMHMNRGSLFLEYGSVICLHGRWMEGRTTFGDGWLARVGSNGTTAANDNYTSVQLMLGTADTIRDVEKEWLAEAIAELRRHGWGERVRPHSDFYQTACPGASIRGALGEIRRLADSGQSGRDWFDMASKKDLEDVVRKVVRAEVGDAVWTYPTGKDSAGKTVSAKRRIVNTHKYTAWLRKNA
jgi:hypothetical protein